MSKKLHVFKQLDEIYNELLNNDSNGEILEILKGIDLERIALYYINTPNEKLDDLDVFTIKKIIEICQYLYNNGDSETPLTDENYDKLLTRYGMENNVINESMKFIREKYQEKLRNGEIYEYVFL